MLNSIHRTNVLTKSENLLISLHRIERKRSENAFFKGKTIAKTNENFASFRFGETEDFCISTPDNVLLKYNEVNGITMRTLSELQYSVRSKKRLLT